MINIKVEHDLDELKVKLSEVGKEKWPKILAYASNETGFYVRNKVYSEMTQLIDKPKPFTLNSLFVKKGKSADPEAIVLWKPGSLSGTSAGKYLIPLVEGGPRPMKKYEYLLQRTGAVPSGYHIVPTKDAPRDAYGNVPGPYIVRMLSFLRALRDPSQNLSKTKAVKKRLQFFIVGQGMYGGNRAGLSRGIYERLSMFGGAIRKVFFFEKNVKYKPIFPFYKISDAAAKEMFDKKLEEGIKKALEGEKGF